MEHHPKKVVLFCFQLNCIFDVMVAIYDFLYKRYIDYAKKYQLQIDSNDDFNTKIDEIQREAITILAPHYNVNERIRSLLEPWVRKAYGTSDATGQIGPPAMSGEEFYRTISMGVVDGSNKLLYPIAPSQENEIILCQLMPQRKPDLTKQRAYYIRYDDITQLYPETSIRYVWFYFIYPTEAFLAFTYGLVDGEYVQTFDEAHTVDLLWDKDASNLLLYMLLEKYGISSRDELIAEFGKLGVQMSLEAPKDGQ